jgi:hypothetical protein
MDSIIAHFLRKAYGQCNAPAMVQKTRCIYNIDIIDVIFYIFEYNSFTTEPMSDIQFRFFGHNDNY